MTGVLASTLSLLSWTDARGAQILTVCANGCDHASIQSAVDAAASGDTIHVAPGVYHEHVVISKSGPGAVDDAYPGGTAYLSGGAAFQQEPASDGSFEVLAADSPSVTIAANTDAAGDSYNYWGQSFTVPIDETHLNLQGFRFLRADDTASGAGTGYLFATEYEGTPAGLAAGSAVASGAWNGAYYDLSASGVTLIAGATYWFYADSPLSVGVHTSGTEAPPPFELSIEGEGAAVTVLDGDGTDIPLRVGENVALAVQGMTVRGGRSPAYREGAAFQEHTVLINLQPRLVFSDERYLDANFDVLAGSPPAPAVAMHAGLAEYLAVWGQSFTVPLNAPPQPIAGFRFLRADGTTPAGAGTGYLFADSPPYLSGAADLSTQPYIASGVWTGSLFDLSAGGHVLVPGRTYFFFADTAFMAGAVDLQAPYNCGGGINNRGLLSLTEVVVEDNETESAGGGVCTPALEQPFGGTTPASGLTLVDSVVTRNTSTAAFYDGGGGGIYAGARTHLTITGSTLSQNDGGWGGGLRAQGGFSDGVTTTITGTTITANTADFGAGMIVDIGETVVEDSTISANTATGQGGGIANLGSKYGTSHLVVRRSTIDGNAASVGGGGIFNGGMGYQNFAITDIEHSTISSNRVTSPQGGGGGIASSGHLVSITSSTISGNEAADGGGIYASYSPYDAGSPLGVELEWSTIAHNTGGGFYTYGVDVRLVGTVLAENPGSDCRGAGAFQSHVISEGVNLASDTSCPLAAPGDRTSTAPLLGPLQDNGGSTLTHAPLPGSPLIDPGASGYGGGDAYLSGGDAFNAQTGTDLDFRVLAAGTGAEIAAQTGGRAETYNFVGQSFTAPDDVTLGKVVLVGSDGTTIGGAGRGYLFDSPYTGTPAQLATATALGSGEWTAAGYDLGDIALHAGTTYWFYVDEPVTVGFAAPPFCPGATDQRGVTRPQDGDGDGVAACDTGAIEIQPPMVDAGGPYTVEEAGTVAVAASAAADPAWSEPITFTWDFDFDGVAFDADALGKSTLFSAAALDGPTMRTIAVRAANDDGVIGTATAVVAVANRAPVVVIDAIDGQVVAGPALVVVLRGHFSDISADAHQADVQWGDGGVTTINPVLPGTAIEAAHTYAHSAGVTVGLVVSDDDGGSGSASTAVSPVALATTGTLRSIQELIAPTTDPAIATALSDAAISLGGSDGGLASNGAVDKFASGDLVAALGKVQAAVTALGRAESAGADSLAALKLQLALVAQLVAGDAYAAAQASTCPPTKGELRQLNTIASLLAAGDNALTRGDYATAVTRFKEAVERSVALL